MKQQSSDRVHVKLSRVLGSFGFHKHLNHYDSPAGGNPLSLVFTDVPGNDLLIQYFQAPSGRTTVKATFNKERTRDWEDLETFFDQIEAVIESWKSGTEEPPEIQTERLRPGRHRKKFKAREILRDVKGGMDDAALMAKYDLSPKGILDLMNKLLWHGLLTPEELADRRSLARTVYMPVFKCRSCGDLQFAKLDQCPRCSGRMVPANENVLE